MPVGKYLALGSPKIDNHQDPSCFIKSYLVDVDDEKMYNNFVAHPSEWPSLGVRYIYIDPRVVVEREEILRWTVMCFGN